MPNLTNMIDETLINLAGYTFQQDRSTYLATPITTTTSSSASPLIMTLGSTIQLARVLLKLKKNCYGSITMTALLIQQQWLRMVVAT